MPFEVLARVPGGDLHVDWSALRDEHDGKDEELLPSQVLVNELDRDRALAYRRCDTFR
jgi:hypothetical protein